MESSFFLIPGLMLALIFLGLVAMWQGADSREETGSGAWW